MQQHSSEEVAECRICRCEGDDERPLFYPCACTGSIKWCHESCLIEWIKVSRTREHCETCGTALVFKPVYSESTPAILSPAELTWLGFKRMAKEAPYAVRASVVVSVWLVFVPIWSASAFNYLRPAPEQQEQTTLTWTEWFATRPSPITFSTWEMGVWVLLAGFFSLFMLVSVFDFVRGFENGEYATELDALRQRAQQRQPQPLIDPPENEVPNQLQPEAQQELAGGNDQHARDPAQAEIPRLENEADDFDLFDDDADQQDGGDDNNNIEINRNDGIEDLGGDQFGFDEWVGLRGPWCLIMNNVMCLCFCVLLFLITFYVVPESLGRGVFREASKAGVPLNKLVQELAQPAQEIIFSYPAMSSVSPLLKEIADFDIFGTDGRSRGSSSAIAEKCMNWNPLHGRGISENSAWNTSYTCNADQIVRSIEKLDRYKLEALSVVVGLTVTMLFIQIQFQACAWSWKMFVSKALSPTFPLRGIPHYLWKSVLKSTRTIVRVQKVVCLLIFKMVAFPIVLGILIERALRPAITVSDEDRILFVADHPHLMALLLWVTGITHTLLVTMNVILIRDILHHDVLDGIIRMRDPHGNQFLPLLVDPIFQQTKRTLVTCMIYTVIVFLFVSIPCYIAQSLGLLPLPLTIRFVVVGVELPAELTLFHMWMLHVLERSKSTLIAFQTKFFRTCCRWLGLTEYLLPVPRNAVEYAQAIQRAQIQAGQLHWLDSAPRVAVDLLRPRHRVKHTGLRIFALLCAAWFTWLTCALVCLVVPFMIGVATVACLPGLPSWVHTDVRLFFVGWVILRLLRKYAPSILLRCYRLLHFASRDVRDSLVFALCTSFFCIAFPLVLGIAVHLETSFSDEMDFPAIKYKGVMENRFTLIATFAQDVFAQLSLIRVWFAGFPFVLLASTQTHTGKLLWIYVFDWKLGRAGRIATRTLISACAVLLLGVCLGLEIWTRAGVHSSPLSSVRISIIGVAGAALTPSYVRKYYEVGRNACKRFHDTLKDEKYLIGRRLKNYDARV